MGGWKPETLFYPGVGCSSLCVSPGEGLYKRIDKSRGTRGPVDKCLLKLRLVRLRRRKKKKKQLWKRDTKC